MVSKVRRPRSLADVQRDPDPEQVELVTCFVSGDVVPIHQAVRVKLGPRRLVWMRPEFCREPDPDRRR